MANDDNYPGFEYQQRVFSIIQEAAVEQGTRWNETWSRIRSGEYQFSDWMNDLGRGLAAHQQFVERVAKAGAPQEERSAWVRLIWRSAEKNPSTTLALGRSLTGTPSRVKMAAFGNSPVDDLYLTWEAVNAGNRVRIAVVGDRPAPGLYIGMLAPNEIKSTPDVIVLLEVE